MTAPEPATTLRVLYRYASSANLKSRPDYFTKSLALASFVRAARVAGPAVRVTFVVDGEPPRPVESVMVDAGDLLRVRCGSNRASYLQTVQLPRTRPVTEDLTWFAEDDYLYEPSSLAELLRAADAIPEASWFALSGPTPPQLLEMRRAQGPVCLPPLMRPGGIAYVGVQPWHRIPSTTSTFGGRTGRIVHDERLLRLTPWTGAAWDRTTCLTVQGITPYPWQHVLADLVVPSTPRRHRAARVAWRVASRVGINLRSVRLPGNRGVLVAPVTPLVGHMNLPYEERPSYWDSVAAATAEWAVSEGIDVG